jgi:hypothetical protein
MVMRGMREIGEIFQISGIGQFIDIDQRVIRVGL